MLRKISLVASMVMLFAYSANAQDDRVEFGFFGGYTFSEGVVVDPFIIQGDVIDKIDVKSGFSYGFNFDVFVTENMQVGFQWGRQESKFGGSGPGADREFTDMQVNNYHGIFTYNWGDGDAAVRPFMYGGLGATNYSPGNIEGSAIESSTRFSTTWGGGVKAYPGRNVGVKVGARWTPTYIKSDAAGIWCSPYWPGACWVLSDTDYSNQFEFFGGITFKF